ncbi:MAG TPA: SDR family oxidoreductase [Gemmatimonadota bacterium]|nr:SDR family oxidoreductase [Gemmatimonadota bacterium]
MSDGVLGMPGLAGKRALVTGGSRGIGRATVRMLAAAGASVGISYRADHAAAEETLEEAARAGEAYVKARGVGLVPLPVEEEEGAESAPDGAPSFWRHAGDLSREEEAEALFDRVDEEFGGLDLFVGNAGIWTVEPWSIDELPSAEWRRMMSVNLDSIYYTSREAVRRMGRGGRIVLLSSTAGQRGEPGHDHYAASKGAIISLAKSLGRELGPRGITVNSVAPGWVDTDMSAPVLDAAGGEEMEEILAEIPLRRVATAGDVAGAIVFLLSDLGRQVNGEVLNVNGGSVVCG